MQIEQANPTTVTNQPAHSKQNSKPSLSPSPSSPEPNREISAPIFHSNYPHSSLQARLREQTQSMDCGRTMDSDKTLEPSFTHSSFERPEKVHVRRDNPMDKYDAKVSKFQEIGSICGVVKAPLLVALQHKNIFNVIHRGFMNKDKSGNKINEVKRMFLNEQLLGKVTFINPFFSQAVLLRRIFLQRREEKSTGTEEKEMLLRG